jgi:5'-3' exonuclease
MCEDYLMGIKWTLEYYFNKCPSWNWNYKYINAPFVSDLGYYFKKNKYDINKIEFAKSMPLTPIVQLLAVLPSNCADLLPKLYGELMVSVTSPIIDLYPSEVIIDMLYKDSLHKCMPMIPNININRILNAVRNIKLNESEKNRNIITENIIANY